MRVSTQHNHSALKVIAMKVATAQVASTPLGRRPTSIRCSDCQPWELPTGKTWAQEAARPGKARFVDLEVASPALGAHWLARRAVRASEAARSPVRSCGVLQQHPAQMWQARQMQRWRSSAREPFQARAGPPSCREGRSTSRLPRTGPLRLRQVHKRLSD
jgi:hypothetical protein